VNIDVMAQEQQKDVPLIALIDAEKKTKNLSAGKRCPADYADRRRKENQNPSAKICGICGRKIAR